jgi:hypothetical protein
MAEFKFSCQGCGQHIQCDEQWCGRQISCPVCGASLTVPPAQAAPAAVLVPRAQPATAEVPASPPAARRLVPKKEPFPVKKLVGWSVGAVAFVVVLWLGLREADVLQVKLDKKQKEIAANSSGGEMTHIAAIYQTLDATDPAKMEARQMKDRAKLDREMADFKEKMKPQPDPTLSMPLAAPQWTLEAAQAQIPSGRLHGSIAGEDFTVENVVLDPSGASRILAFQQGVGTTADHEVFVYLGPNNNDSVAGRSWMVTKETKGKDVPQIIKRWTANPKFAPISKTYFYGYAMRLEFGQPGRDWLPGRIYLALPDTNQTVLGGSFSLPMPHPVEELR